MDENELRIFAAEKAAIALAAHREPCAVNAALHGLVDELGACLTEDERLATLQAIHSPKTGAVVTPSSRRAST